MRLLRQTCIAASCLFILSHIGGCNGRKAYIHYVVPDGYHGYLVMRLNVDGGAKSVEVKDVFTYRFPATGVLDVADEGPFFTRPYIDAAAFASGGSLPVLSIGEPVGSGKIGFWDISNDDQKRIWYYVGTDAEYKSKPTVDDEIRKRFPKR
jgi:hypothetical protein